MKVEIPGIAPDGAQIIDREVIPPGKVCVVFDPVAMDGVFNKGEKIVRRPDGELVEDQA